MGRGRKKLTSEDYEFARDVGKKLDEAIEAHDLTRDEAAEKLGIHRSMLFRYLAGKSIPGSNVLRRACEELGLSVDFRGLKIDAEYFRESPQVEKIRPVAIQEEFAFMREWLAGKFANVDIRKKKRPGGDVLELRVTVRLGKAGVARQE